MQKPFTDEVKLYPAPDHEDQLDASGRIWLKQLSTERIQMIAEILAKNLVLAHYETALAETLDRIEPLAAELRSKRRTGRDVRALLRQIGDVLLIGHRMVGRAEATEKPEVLWDHPELERLYVRLEAEFELRERAHALEAKLGLVSRTCETLLGLVQHKQSLRVEWSIVALIVIELLFTIVPLAALLAR